MAPARVVPDWASTRFAALARRARQLPERVIPHWAKIVRLTTAAVIAYLFAKLVDPSVSDLTGPLTALLVVQSSLTQSLTSGIGRVASVLTGILVAVTLSIWVGLTWWSLGIAIGSALILAHLLRLELIKVPHRIEAGAAEVAVHALGVADKQHRDSPG